jgi:SAM-dependent methyltransferase
MDLKPLLQNCSQYFGTDIIPPPIGDGDIREILSCDLEQPLPFGDGSFDVVVALDVLEHLNNPHGTIRELLRVARKAVLISLPNMYYIQFRLNFLRGRLSEKYCFHPHPVVDRHRWILSYSEALQFIRINAAEYHIEYEMVLPRRGRTKLIMEPLERWLGKTWPNLFAYGILFEITLRDGDQ